MSHDAYERLQACAHRIAKTLPLPAFYERHAAAVRFAGEHLAASELITECRAFLDESQLECAHGLCHCEAVARDAGALVLIEAPGRGIGEDDAAELFLAAELAGLLHDIKRKEHDHARLGSIAAERILKDLGLEKKFRTYIVDAIRNHEAFKATTETKDKAGKLVSDALYDADKFRWGPENFTTTLWAIVTAHDMPPESLHRVFKEKMKGIEKIKDTFRTRTGSQFGPEIIDQGITIGNVIYREMNNMMENGSLS
jgi:HD superfamily phosphohydrolase YqeK